MERLLTPKFVTDLQSLSPQPRLLMFDALEERDPRTLRWLIDELLVSLMLLEHIRVVMAGQSVPQPAGSYAARCHSCELVEVKDEAAYIQYCGQQHLKIGDQSIKDIARLLDYQPGMFADMVVKKFRQQGV
jgi:hypothetical protein